MIALDIGMPGMDGWSVLGALKDDPRLCDVPVIIVTMVDAPQRGFAPGAADHLPKPLDRRRMVRLLRKHSASDAPGPVLVVDDDATARTMMRDLLEREGRTVREAGDGRAGLAAMERERPGLVLLDLMMPEMDGFEFADQVRRRPEWRSILIVVTARDVSVAERRRLSGSVDTVLRKVGDSQETLLKRVSALLDDCGVPRAAVNATDEASAESP